MFSKLADKVADIVVESGKADKESRDIYSYGINQALTVVLDLVTTLIIGICFHMLWQILLFIGAYVPLRSFCGGVHAKTPLRCYASSVVLLIAVELAVKNYMPSGYIFIAAYVISALLILTLSPVEDLNKPLDDIEQKVYKRRSLVIWLVGSVLILVLYLLKFKTASLCILLSQAVLAVMLILGVIKNRVISAR